MSKNLIAEVCKLLNVEIGEEFKVKGNSTVFRISSDGRIEDKAEEGWFRASLNIRDLLNGEDEIVKLPWKPKDKEEFWSFYLLPNGVLMLSKRQWNDQTIEYLAMYKAGWVYRTREEANAALHRLAKELEVEYEQ